MIDKIKSQVYYELVSQIHPIKQKVKQLKENADMFISFLETLDPPIKTLINQIDFDYQHICNQWLFCYHKLGYKQLFSPMLNNETENRYNLRNQFDFKYEQFTIVVQILNSWAKNNKLKTVKDYSYCGNNLDVFITCFLSDIIKLNTKMPLTLLKGLTLRQKHKESKKWKIAQNKIQELLKNFETDCLTHSISLQSEILTEKML